MRQKANLKYTNSITMELPMLLPTMFTPAWAGYCGQSCRWADESLVCPGIQLVEGWYVKWASWILSFCTLDAQDLLGWKLLPSQLLHQAPSLPEEVWVSMLWSTKPWSPQSLSFQIFHTYFSLWKSRGIHRIQITNRYWGYTPAVFCRKCKWWGGGRQSH